MSLRVGVARHTLVIRLQDFASNIVKTQIFKRFREIGDPGMIPRTMTSQEASSLRLPLSYLARIPELKENPFRERISEVFTQRQDSGQSTSEGICFEEFLEMLSVFSEQAPRDLKVFYAFKIYGTNHQVDLAVPIVVPWDEEYIRRSDTTSTMHENICTEQPIDFAAVQRYNYTFVRAEYFDEDGVLGLGDLERTCRQLTRGGLSAEEVTTVCRKILEESDIDGDGALSYLEFEHVVTRSSDFMATFHIRI
ncbi:Calcium and integrin-binding family member 2 [Trachymyrmex zeteki]|uniref:Calcium and integrin-binding family member 2 n=1 Tax=Mycetomoellerius zeteki TaxID=64791 RepID=A0A151XEE4_9HYME|nr:Calcium and integrin-binding family member 2 [Trachymyrmex zeteki]